jgi:hypothetical protein
MGIYILTKRQSFNKKHIEGAVNGLIGNPVKFGSGPAAVTGDERRTPPLFQTNGMGRRGK